ncbi:MAG TPA: SRPBCC domain-containing protein [bacterium]|nr:SRPBCC domain-containing protein [bacterium]
MKTIQQKVRFKAPPDQLYEMYMGSGRPAREGDGPFSAHEGYVRGRNLQLVPGQLVVQSWRGADWAEGEPDSILFLTFEPVPGGGQVTLVHAGLSPEKAERHARGWRDYYWTPWKNFLRRRGRAG